MTKSLDEIAKQLKDSDKNVNLIYAFNGTGKTRLSKVFKDLIAPKENHGNEEDLTRRKILYFNAFTEDLFYWDNDLVNDTDPKLKIQPNSFIRWLIKDQGDEGKVIGKFHHYCDEKLMPKFDIENNQITFSFARGDNTPEENIKLSKGEESNFIWSIFHTLIEQVVAELNIPEPSERTTNEFDELKYIFIDDPVSSLDENHLIQLAVDLAKLVKDSPNTIKFIITTHNPLFYNILYNETSRLKNKKRGTFRLEKTENNTHNLYQQNNDSPFTYQVHLFHKLEDIFKKEIQPKEFLKEFLLNIENDFKYKEENFLNTSEYDMWLLSNKNPIYYIRDILNDNINKEIARSLDKKIKTRKNKEFKLTKNTRKILSINVVDLLNKTKMLNDNIVNILNGGKIDDKKLSIFYQQVNDKIKEDTFFIKKNYVLDHEFKISFFKEKNIEDCQVEKYHFNLIRNILEKLATFLGYREMKNVLPQDSSGPDLYMNRIVNLSSHSKHSDEETVYILSNDKRVLKNLVEEHICKKYHFRSNFIKLGKI